MHAVITKATIHDIDRAKKILKEEGIPRMSQAPGFVAGHWVRLDESTGTGMIIFESEEAAQGAAERIRTNAPAGDAVTINSIEIGEVVGHA
jgi:hypothetical protein